MNKYLLPSAIALALLLPLEASAGTQQEKWSPSAIGRTLQQAKGGAENYAKYQSEEFCRSKGGVKSIIPLDWKTSAAYDKSSFSASMKYKVVCFK